MLRTSNLEARNSTLILDSRDTSFWLVQNLICHISDEGFKFKHCNLKFSTLPRQTGLRSGNTSAPVLRSYFALSFCILPFTDCNCIYLSSKPLNFQPSILCYTTKIVVFHTILWLISWKKSSL